MSKTQPRYTEIELIKKKIEAGNAHIKRFFKVQLVANRPEDINKIADINVD